MPHSSIINLIFGDLLSRASGVNKISIIPSTYLPTYLTSTVTSLTSILFSTTSLSPISHLPPAPTYMPPYHATPHILANNRRLLRARRRPIPRRTADPSRGQSDRHDAQHRAGPHGTARVRDTRWRLARSRPSCAREHVRGPGPRGRRAPRGRCPGQLRGRGAAGGAGGY